MSNNEETMQITYHPWDGRIENSVASQSPKHYFAIDYSSGSMVDLGEHPNQEAATLSVLDQQNLAMVAPLESWQQWAERNAMVPVPPIQKMCVLIIDQSTGHPRLVYVNAPFSTRSQ